MAVGLAYGRRSASRRPEVFFTFVVSSAVRIIRLSDDRRESEVGGGALVPVLLHGEFLHKKGDEISERGGSQARRPVRVRVRVRVRL